MWNPRKNYKPIQPTPFRGSDNIQYSEILPDPSLQSIIYCYWELKTLQALPAPYPYRVVSDGCIDLFFEVEKPLKCLVMGFCNQYTEFNLDSSFHYIGIRFFPTVFPLLIDVDASELSNKVVELADVDKKIAASIARGVRPGLTCGDFKSLFDVWFCKHLHRHTIEDDKRLGNAVDLIFRRGGSLRVEKDIDMGLSPRQLRRLFNFYIGDSVKAFCKVVRFQKFLQESIIDKQRIYNAIGNEAYFDQSHLIKDFKRFYGTTPGCLPDR